MFHIDARYPYSPKGCLLSDAQVKVYSADSTGISLRRRRWYSGSLFSMDIELTVLDTSSENPMLVNGPGDLAYLMVYVWIYLRYAEGGSGEGAVMLSIMVKGVNYITFGSSDRLLQTGSVVVGALTFERSWVGCCCTVVSFICWAMRTRWTATG